MSDEKYGNVNITTIQKTKNDLRDALSSGDLEAAQKAWDRLEQWIDSPPMMPKTIPQETKVWCKCKSEFVVRCDCMKD